MSIYGVKGYNLIMIQEIHFVKKQLDHVAESSFDKWYM